MLILPSKNIIIKIKMELHRVKEKIFGYRYHLLADVDYELPIDYTVTKASAGERKQLLKKLKEMEPEKREKIKTLSADKGYDGEELIKEIKGYGIKPIIDIKNQWKDEEKRQSNIKIQI
ncbi:MAG: transposase [Bacilli bacterium]